MSNTFGHGTGGNPAHGYKKDQRGPRKEIGGNFSQRELIEACKNIGYDLNCGGCAAIFYTGVGLPGDVHTCENAEEYQSSTILVSYS